MEKTIELKILYKCIIAAVRDWVFVLPSRREVVPEHCSSRLEEAAHHSVSCGSSYLIARDGETRLRQRAKSGTFFLGLLGSSVGQRLVSPLAGGLVHDKHGRQFGPRQNQTTTCTIQNTDASLDLDKTKPQLVQNTDTTLDLDKTKPRVVQNTDTTLDLDKTKP